MYFCIRWYQLLNLGFIHKYLTRSAAEKIVHALISSRLDFGNALLYNLPQTKLAKIQRLQNAAARIVTLTRKYTHITPILKSLHWLPIEQRIKFTILLSVFHCVQGSAPQYNLSLINVYNPVRSLRSADSGFLVVPACYKSWGGAGLCTCGAITLELITISFKKYVFKRVIQNWVENIPFSWVLSLFSCVCILSSLNAPWAYHLWIRRNINHTYYYYYY